MTATTISAADVDAVCFDCFGTLLSVAEGAFAYRRLVSTAPDRRAMRHQVLTTPRTFEEHAAGAGWTARDITGGRMALDEELASIALLDDSPRILEALRAQGLKVALCSNLATEFGPAAHRALGFLFDTTVLSYEVGLTKPDAAIFRTVCRNLDCAPRRVLMVGDSLHADIEGGRAAGLHALRIHREPTGGLPGDLTNLAQLLTLL